MRKSKVMENLVSRFSGFALTAVKIQIRAAIKEYDEMIEGASLAAGETKEWGTDAKNNRIESLAAFGIEEE